MHSLLVPFDNPGSVQVRSLIFSTLSTAEQLMVRGVCIDCDHVKPTIISLVLQFSLTVNENIFRAGIKDRSETSNILNV